MNEWHEFLINHISEVLKLDGVDYCVSPSPFGLGLVLTIVCGMNIFFKTIYIQASVSDPLSTWMWSVIYEHKAPDISHK